MYDVGLPAEYADQPVGRDRGMALEESQSLLMEMIVCRSRGFVSYLKIYAPNIYNDQLDEDDGTDELYVPASPTWTATPA